MGTYNVKVLEYYDSIQLRIYDKPIRYDFEKEDFENADCEVVNSEKEDFENADCEKEDKENSESIRISLSRSKNAIYEIARSNTWDYFITLTFDQKKIDSSDYDLISKKTSKFFSNLRLRFAPDLKYLIVPELHKDRKHYHFHAIISNIGDINLVDSGIMKNGNKIYNFANWKYGFSTATQVIDSGRVSSYISKYISKELLSVTFVDLYLKLTQVLRSVLTHLAVWVTA